MLKSLTMSHMQNLSELWEHKNVCPQIWDSPTKFPREAKNAFVHRARKLWKVGPSWNDWMPPQDFSEIQKVGPFFASWKGMVQFVLASNLSYSYIEWQALSTSGHRHLTDSIQFGFVLYCTYEF